MKADKMSMAHSLELRVPFLDVEVFQVAASLPVRHRIGRGTTKLALREAVKDLLPPEVVHRPKLGFPIPIVDWIADDMHDFIQDVYHSVRPACLDRDYVDRLLNHRSEYVWNRDRKIWTVLVFLLWYQAYMEAPGVAEAAGTSRCAGDLP